MCRIYSITHDPSLSIKVYLQAISAAKSKLKVLSDVLLMHFHSDSIMFILLFLLRNMFGSLIIASSSTLSTHLTISSNVHYLTGSLSLIHDNTESQ